MGFLQMKTLVLAGLLATSASAAVNTTAPPPYTFLLKFPDGSLEICPSTGFSIGLSVIDVDVVSCVADKVFADHFGG